MRRGTTPTHTFTPDIDLTGVESLYITYQQDGETVVEKSIDDVLLNDDGTVSVELSQNDTLAFKAKGRVEAQIRVRFPDGSALASEVVKITSERILKDGEI